MNTSQRARPDLKPRFPRIKLLLQKRQASRRYAWYSTADDEGNVSIRPTKDTNA